MKKRRRKQKKVLKGLIGISVILICMGATAAVTWALLTTQSEDKINVFTGTAGLTLKAHEPNWDTTGEAKANNYSPNLEIDKDPYLENTTEIKTGHENDSKEYVAIRLTYQINAGTTLTPKWESISYEAFQRLATIYHLAGGSQTGFNLAANDTDRDTNKWIKKNDTYTVFYYNTILDGKTDPGVSDETSKLFDSVKIKDDLESDGYFKCDIAAHYTESGSKITSGDHKGLIQFRIVVEGFAVQAYEDANKVSFDTAKTRLDTLMMNNPAPTDTP